MNELTKITILKNEIENMVLKNSYESFIKALISYLRDINNIETLNEMYKKYDNYDISLLNTLILEEEEEEEEDGDNYYIPYK